MPATGGDVTVIAPVGERDVAHFRADQPDRIYAYSGAEGLVSFRWDGTDVKQHLEVRGALPPGVGSPHPAEPEALPRRVFPEWAPADAGEGGPQPPPAGLVLVSPRGGRALAQVGRQVYVVDIPSVGGPVPSVSVASPASAPVPVRQLTDVGGEFPSWSADGRRVHWPLGNAFFTFDLARVEAIADSVELAERETVGRALRVRAVLDRRRRRSGCHPSPR